ncbi:MAG TPA: ATP-binding protein [Anaerolineales bacterium]|nr:ATP-binding protein [Anaerolineales bacterium]
MQTSIGEIRRRLLLLLLRASVIVLSLSFLFFILTAGYFLASSPNPFHAQIANALEGYYLGHGSWDGVEAVFESTRALSTLNTILLDKDQRVVLDRRPNSVLTAGSRYEFGDRDIVIVLKANHAPVGYLVIAAYSLALRFGFIRAILFPIALIALILAMFLGIVAILLTRRFVNPLADVIYAARAVANGDLKTRIPTKGPQDLRSLSNSFNEMAASLERSDHERRDMLADIAHELRTPLSVIRGRLEGIVDGIYPENGTQVSMALEQTYVLQRLVDDLRLLTLAETRQLPFDKQNVNIDDVTERVLALFSAEAGEKNISLSFSEKNGDLSAFVDPQRFEQVLSNLVGNALRYVPEGGRVWVTANETPDGVQITVNDNGAGIPAQDLPFIFDRFWRKEKSRARVSGGTGLGLAIARQLIEAQGGTIEARNLPEGGLQIVVTLRK